MSHCYDVINATYRTYPWLFLFLDIYEPSRQEPSLELIFHNFSNFVQEKAESARSDQEGGVGTHRQQAAHQHSFLLYKSPFQNRGSNFSLRNSQTSMAFRTNKSVTRPFMVQPHFSLWRIGVFHFGFILIGVLFQEKATTKCRFAENHLSGSSCLHRGLENGNPMCKYLCSAEMLFKAFPYLILSLVLGLYKRSEPSAKI